MRVVVLAMLATLVVTSRPAHAERVAVLPVDAARDGGASAIRAAAGVREVLKAQGFVVVDEAATRAKFNDYLRPGTDIAQYQQRFDQSEQALAALDQDRSISILETLIKNLAEDPAFSREKQALLEIARLKLASRLIGLAGRAEKGNAETEFGKRAQALLVDALRANPKFAPAPNEYAPRFFDILERARGVLSQLGTGGLSVDSRPQGATVFLEGRDIGKTPLALGKDVLAKGNYRLWVEANGVRSVTKQVKIDDVTPRIDVDLAFEGALWPEGSGLRPVIGTIDEQVGQKVGNLLEVDTVILVGRAHYEDSEDDSLFGAALAVGEGSVVRRGSVTLKEGVGIDAAARDLASFLSRGERGRVDEKAALPDSVLPLRKPGVGPEAVSSSAPTLSVSSTSIVADDFPWLYVGLGAGAVVAVTAGVIAAVLLVPRDGAVVITLDRSKPSS